MAFLERLIGSVSPSGYEEQAAKVWRAEAEGFADVVRRDCHGNTDAVVHAGGAPRVMLSGHYDEIGFIVSHIDSEGFLWFSPVGGWDPQIPQGQRVVVLGANGRVPGVLGKCPIHLLKPDARDKVTKLEEQWIDIGARNRKQAEKLVSVGDPVVIDLGLGRLGDDLLVGRGFDNRLGAYIVLEAARRLGGRACAAEVHAVATAQEEIGIRGARTAAFGIDPQVGVAVDVAFATDHPSMGEAVKREGKIKLGGGVVISRGPNIHPRLFQMLVETARKKKIAHQISADGGATGTDANVIQISRAGVATALLGVPLRYMHTACELAHVDDIEAAVRLLAEFVSRLTPETDLTPF